MKYIIQYSFKEFQIRINNYIFQVIQVKIQDYQFGVVFVQLLCTVHKLSGLLYTLPDNDWAPF